MKGMEGIKFKGTFRDYQQRVLDNSEKYLVNKKIHIVAAPGSGKTILGLELICRLNSPALIFSPTITIKNQWADRLKNFMPDGEDVNDYISLNLKKFKLFTSTTYQGLHAALNKLDVKSDTDSEDSLEQENYSFEDYNLIDAVKKANIKTICLDEAHHLRTEWHKSLTKFISLIGEDITVIALTATPPYDSDFSEWNNYIELCGEIDEEVLVPELVQKKNLCPHQDYVIYNFPTESEMNVSKKYVDSTWKALKQISESNVVKKLLENSAKWKENGNERFYDFLPILGGLYSLAEYYNLCCDAKTKRYLKKNTNYKTFSILTANNWLNEFQKNMTVYGEDDFNELFSILKSNNLVIRNKICLGVSPKVNKTVMSSLGKLTSIKKICEAEINSLGEDLRMLILTDFIKRDSMRDIGTNNEIKNISVISIFESLRREKINANLAVLSGTTVIINHNAVESLKAISEKSDCNIQTKNLGVTDYCECLFVGASNKQKVSMC